MGDGEWITWLIKKNITWSYGPCLRKSITLMDKLMVGDPVCHKHNYPHCNCLHPSLTVHPSSYLGDPLDEIQPNLGFELLS